MAYKVNSLEEMPNALSYLIESVEALQTKVNALQHKQASNSPKWMDIDELCAYLPSHPAKQTVYGWVSTKQITYQKLVRKPGIQLTSIVFSSNLKYEK